MNPWRSLALVLGLLCAPAAGAVEVLSVAHAPTNAANRFHLQCGRAGVMRVSAVVDVQGEIPTVLLGGIATATSQVATQRRSYPKGPAFGAGTKKLGGQKGHWILSDAFAWTFSCRADCGEIRVGAEPFAGDVLQFRFVVGGEVSTEHPAPPAFAPRTTAETETLTLRCAEATALPPG